MNSAPPTATETCPAELPNFCAQRHWSIFWILILCSVCMVCGRILTLANSGQPDESPFFSANDRSRWTTVRALGDDGTFEFDRVIANRERLNWDSIDKVRHVGPDGRFHFYSSKPTLLPTALAGVYRGIQQLTGWTLEEDTTPVVRSLLLLLNGGGWFAFLFFLAKTINAVPVRDWARYYVLACAGFGTMLSTFAISLNNHLPAAVCVMISLYGVATILRRPESTWPWFAMTGLFAGLAAANELPALSFVAAAGVLCATRSLAKTAVAFSLGLALVAGGFFGTNYLAHQTWKPAYGHRSDGEILATVSGDFRKSLDLGQLPGELREANDILGGMTAPAVESDGWPGTPPTRSRWVVRDAVGVDQVAIVTDDQGVSFQIRQWNNWYDYPGSYWSTANQDRKSEVDRGQPNLPIYAFHLLFGHHGIFSLTPIWLLGFAGMLALAGGARIAGRYQMRWLGWLGLALSVLVVAFYLRRPEMDRNYGGVTSGLRWVLWLAPVWLVSMLPVVDWLARTRMGKACCYGLLVVSALSACYALDNPWVHPWLYEVWDLTGIQK